MENKDSRRYLVWLVYSGDYVENREKKEADLYKGGDLVTKVLNHFKIPYIITLGSDFYGREPELERVIKYDRHGREYELFDLLGYHTGGQGYVIGALMRLGIIPCSFEEAVKTIGGKNG